MLRIELKEDRPGYALFSAAKWKGVSEVEISIQRNQDSRYFAGQGQWNPEPVWHKVNGLSLDGETLQGTIGPWLIDELVQQVGNIRYMLSVRDNTNTDSGPVRMVGNILASLASGDSSRENEVKEHQDPVIETPAFISEPEPTPAEPVVETITPPEPESMPEPVMSAPVAPTPEKKSKLGLIIGLIVLLVAIAGALFFFLNKPEQAQSVPQPCTIDAVQGDELAFIQSCLKTNPEPKQILSLIEGAKKANKCSIAQRLYANQAQGGNVDIAIAYAGEYEKGSSCFEMDKSTAIYWYETALSNDPNNAVAKQKLAELKP